MDGPGSGGEVSGVFGQDVEREDLEGRDGCLSCIARSCKLQIPFYQHRKNALAGVHYAVAEYEVDWDHLWDRESPVRGLLLIVNGNALCKTEGVEARQCGFAFCT